MTSKPQLALILVSVSTPEQAADSKQSLETQERDLRAIAGQRGWQVIDVLRIPGFSRNYISWEECAADMLKQGITAMSDLKRHCEQHTFDVFMVRDADRFGRTQSLIMQIAETICIRHRLKIYSQIDNTLVEGESSRFWAAMTGLRSAGEMDKKKLYRETGMVKRAENGFHEGHTTWFHRTVHDPDTGKALCVEVREEYRYIWDAVYKIIVEDRIGFGMVEQVLHQKYHIVNPVTGRPFRPKAFYETLCMLPAAWGHRYRGKKAHKRNVSGGLSGEWVYDRTIPPPDDVTLFYDVLPPIYTGHQADAMIDELRRRRTIRGGSNPTNPSTFSGLVVCDYCHNHLIFNQRPLKFYAAYRCQTHDRHRFGGPDCPCKPKTIGYKHLAEWLTPFLEKLLDGEPLDSAFPSSTPSVGDQIAAIEQQLTAVTEEKTRLIARLGLIPDSMLQDYQRQMQTVAERADGLKKQLHDLLAQSATQDRTNQVAALHDLASIGIPAFWELDAGRQQQLLKRLFGKWRIVVADGVIIGVAQASGTRTSRKLRS